MLSRFFPSILVLSFALAACAPMAVPPDTPTPHPPTNAPLPTSTPVPTEPLRPTPTSPGPLAEASRDGLKVQILKVEENRIYMRVQADESWRFQPDFLISPFARFDTVRGFSFTDNQGSGWSDKLRAWKSERATADTEAGLTYLDSITTLSELPPSGEKMTLIGNLEIFYFFAQEAVTLDLSERKIGDTWDVREVVNCRGRQYDLGQATLLHDLTNERFPLQLKFTLASNQHEAYQLSSVSLFEYFSNLPPDISGSSNMFNPEQSLLTFTANLRAALDENNKPLIPSEPIALTAVCDFTTTEPFTLTWTMP